MQTRRRFITIFPLAGMSALAACGDKAGPSTVAQAPAAAPAPASAPTAGPASPPAPASPTTPAVAATGPMVDPADAAAVALGYVSDAKTTRDAKHTAGAACGNCALFGSKAGDPSGPCPLFAGKQVAATGWCTAYAKKA